MRKCTRRHFDGWNKCRTRRNPENVTQLNETGQQQAGPNATMMVDAQYQFYENRPR
ncbi:hypothetical protein ACF1BU_17515 [Streptomyces sp. NPDC014724]|uniref:hypothetical protein n=1 Tax=unclassified Streptomyces TaxID=2593676 RepID=UPI003700E653